MRDIVYHYTSHEVALSIFMNEELWLTNISYLNDRYEFWWTYTQFKNYCAKRSLENDEIFPATKAKVDRFISSQEKGISICVACFSAKPDDAAQWHRYAIDGRGVAIGFSIEGLHLALGAKHGQADFVLYGVEECEKNLDSAIRDLEAADQGGQQLAGTSIDPLPRVATFTKEPSFTPEEEYRLALYGVFYGNYKFRPSANSLVPYVPLRCSRECIADIKMGPNASRESINAWSLLITQVNGGSDTKLTKLSRSSSGLR